MPSCPESTRSPVQLPRTHARVSECAVTRVFGRHQQQPCASVVCELLHPQCRKGKGDRRPADSMTGKGQRSRNGRNAHGAVVASAPRAFPPASSSWGASASQTAFQSPASSSRARRRPPRTRPRPTTRACAPAPRPPSAGPPASPRTARPPRPLPPSGRCGRPQAARGSCSSTPPANTGSCCTCLRAIERGKRCAIERGIQCTAAVRQPACTHVRPRRSATTAVPAALPHATRTHRRGAATRAPG